MPAKKSAKKQKETAAPPKKSGRRAEEMRRSPRRREFGAGLCFLLGVFTTLAYFGTDALLIGWLRFLFTGLLGWGFYVVPPAFFVIAAILAFH